MKKFLLVLVAAMFCFAISSNAQGLRYRGQAFTGVSVGNGGFHYAPIQTVQGFEFGKMFFAGVGTGLNIWRGGEISIPLYANAKAYWNFSDKFDAYGSFDLGGNIGTGMIPGGVYVSPMVGARYKLVADKYWVGLALGYSYTSSVGQFAIRVTFDF